MIDDDAMKTREWPLNRIVVPPYTLEDVRENVGGMEVLASVKDTIYQILSEADEVDKYMETHIEMGGVKLVKQEEEKEETKEEPKEEIKEDSKLEKGKEEPKAEQKVDDLIDKMEKVSLKEETDDK